MILQNLPFVVSFLEILAAVLGSIYFYKYRNSSERYFLHFLWFTVVVEMCAVILNYGFSNKIFEINMYINTFPLYNVFIIVSFLFYFYWYNSILKSKRLQWLTILAGVATTVTSVTYLVLNGWKSYDTYTFLTGAIFLLIFTVLHFYQLLNSDEVLIVKYKLSFWISTALLLFYMGMIPLFFLSKYLNFQGLSYGLTLVTLNLILYGCYSIGFIWTKKKYNHF